jgi:His/Glu/Gln/Arg/opine family amino acid ABC transporter permease subunit
MNLDWSVIWVHRAELLEGVGLTILLTVLTMLFAIPGGILLALMRLSSMRWLQLAATSFVEFFRNLPLILVVYWAFYVMPVLFGIEFSPFGTGLIALCLNVSAYNSETFRAGINSIRRGQFEAGTALGLSRWQLMRKIIIPQAGRRVLPVLASTWVSLFKDTSLVSVIAVGELAHVALSIRSQTFRVLEMLTAMAAIYWLLGYPQAKLVDWIHRKYGVREI